MVFDKKFYFIIYGILVILPSLCFESKIYLPFYLAFACLIGWLYFSYESYANKSESDTNGKRWWWLVIIALVIILASRIIPFLGTEAPLGYDTGIYKKLIEDFALALPGLPQFAEGMWGLSQPWGLFLNANLLFLIGFSGSQILYGYYIFLNLLLGLSVYVLVKKFFNRNAAICSLFIFVLSLTQFHTYWMMYYKNILGMFLMLIAFYLLKQKSWLVIPLAGFLGAVHRPTFLIFGLAMLAFWIVLRFQRQEVEPLSRGSTSKHYVLFSGIGILAVAFSLYIHNPQAIFHFLSPNLQELAKTFGPGAGAGTFFSFEFYRQIITFYLPFAILGLIYLIQKKQFNYLFFYFIFNFAIVYFNLIFHNRFIIHLDIIVIILAGVSASYILAKFWQNKEGKAAICILLIGVLYILGVHIKNTKPLISNNELTEIKSLANTEKNAYAMAVASYYSPWVYGYSQRRTIAPGLFEYNKWNLKKWQTFWSSSNLELRHQLLDEYEKPLYIYVGDKVGKMDFSNDPGFIRISKRIWKYVGQ